MRSSSEAEIIQLLPIRESYPKVLFETESLPFMLNGEGRERRGVPCG